MVEGPKVKLKRERLLQQLHHHQGQRPLHSITLSSVINYFRRPPNYLSYLSNKDSLKVNDQYSSPTLKNDDALPSILLWSLLSIVVVGKELMLCFATLSPFITSLLKSLPLNTEADSYHEQADWALLEALYQKMLSSETIDVFMIRIHFGMSGSERLVFSSTQASMTSSDLDIDQLSKDHEVFAHSTLPPHSRKKLSAVINLRQPLSSNSTNVYETIENINLYIFDSTITVVENPLIKLKAFLAKRYLDVMNSTFCDFSRIREKLKEDKKAIQEAVLDQDILPGVGNVIKCEALFRCKLHPELPSCSLSDIQCEELIHALQDFSWEWYHATKKRGKDVLKQIYGRSECSLCQHAVSLVRFSGVGSFQRITYFCPQCQPMNASNGIQHQLPKSNADPNNLSGSTCSKRSFDHCQESSSRYCDMSDVLRWSCNFCNCDNMIVMEKEEDLMQAHCVVCGEKIPAAMIEDKSNNKRVSIIEETAKIESIPIAVTAANSSILSSLKAQKCRCGKSACLQRVRTRTSPNLHRLFWSCAMNRGKSGCSFFAWADASFPKCSHNQSSAQDMSNNSKPHFTILRRVLKPGQNNGRYFYSCSNSGCGFFQWEDGNTQVNGVGNDSYYQGSIPL